MYCLTAIPERHVLKYFEDSRGNEPRSSRHIRRRRGTHKQNTAQPSVAQRADWQLASQVERVLELCLAGSRNPVLHNLDVLSVWHTQGKLFVRVVSSTHDANEIANHLAQASGWLRREIAEEITRKRVPELRFEILPDSHGESASSGVGEEEQSE